MVDYKLFCLNIRTHTYTYTQGVNVYTHVFTCAFRFMPVYFVVVCLCYKFYEDPNFRCEDICKISLTFFFIINFQWNYFMIVEFLDIKMGGH